MKQSGLAIHCHHDVLIEHCYDYKERVDYIKKNKPANERKVRLRLFKLLPQEAIDELPKRLIKADAEWDKAYAEWDKADAERHKANAEWHKADAERHKANAERHKANAEWTHREAWHKKWCGCKEWNNKEIVF